MPTIDINTAGNMLFGGFAVLIAVLWFFLHLSAVRDLHEGTHRRLD
jgi:hypothetical protein